VKNSESEANKPGNGVEKKPLGVKKDILREELSEHCSNISRTP
jgi:hypothetical protein